MSGEIAPDDLDRLRRAVQLLEEDGLTIRLTAMLGGAVEAGGGWVGKFLPKGAEKLIADATQAALAKALDVALLTVDRKRTGPTGWSWLDNSLQSRAFDATLATVSGAGGGFFGLASTAAELPITTTIIMRGIVGAALKEGEDLSNDETKLECLKVFAFGGPARGDDGAESSYFATRLALSELIPKVGGKSLAELLPRVIAQVAARFGVPVSAKIAAQLTPFLGAASGALLNLVFIDHFQNKAEGHFTLRRLERAYGAETVRVAYDALRAERLAAAG